ncbi:hypothetical protein IY145_17795 [Methylosinus sp. H3A]|uniref:hypothetical protein n=1 Tax=Methylosinus sp. H3A TaxID=2785786 RepID=UPI0018C311DC|nr:hypothetical protein [Methylosinus sp. H3A]MBG0811212.1 hypothetical protein [Methylosinus sp. H3A]
MPKTPKATSTKKAARSSPGNAPQARKPNHSATGAAAGRKNAPKSPEARLFGACDNIRRNWGGRPFEYRPEFDALAIELGAAGLSSTGIAGAIGVHRDTLRNWARHFPSFAQALALARAAQVTFYERNLANIARYGARPGQAIATLFALRTRAGEEWLAPRSPALGELHDEDTIKDVTPDPEATEEEIGIVQRALTLRLSVDDSEITDEMLHDVVLSPIAPEPEPPTVGDTSIMRALAFIAERGGSPPLNQIVEASLAAHRRKNAGTPSASTPAPEPASPKPIDGEIIAPAPKRRIIRI